MKPIIQANFNKAASKYDNYSEIQKKASAHLAKITHQNINAEAIQSILDIGAGTGQTTIEFRNYYKNAHYTLCDISEKMIEESRKKIKNAEYVVCDAENYDFQNRYDLCISNLAIQWFENLENFIERTLGNCQYFAFSTLLNTSFLEYKAIFMDANIPSPTFQYYDLEKFKKIAKKYGHILCFESQSHKEFFEDALSAAKQFKNIGAALSSCRNFNYISTLAHHKKSIYLNYDIFFAIIKGK